MRKITDGHTASLADDIVHRINRKQADLASAVARRAGDHVTRGLLDEIATLAEEFRCALYVEQLLRLIRRRSAGGESRPA